MRIQSILIAVLLAGSSSLHATETITQDTLNRTLLDGQNAIQQDNYSEAFDLYNQAARWGHKGAQYVLGEMYIQGKGVARDQVTGYAWLEVAAEAPDREFLKARTAARKSLNDEQQIEGKLLAQKISDIYGTDAVGVSCKKEMRVGSNIKVVNCYHRHTTASGDLIVPDSQADGLPAS